MYKVVEQFSDLQDENHRYHKGDVYPRKGLKVTKERYAELSGKDNKRGLPLIKEVKRQRSK